MSQPDTVTGAGAVQYDIAKIVIAGELPQILAESLQRAGVQGSYIHYAGSALCQMQVDGAAIQIRAFVNTAAQISLRRAGSHAIEFEVPLSRIVTHQVGVHAAIAVRRL